jgi:hypothetical protein
MASHYSRLWKSTTPTCNYYKQSGDWIKDRPVKANSGMGLKTCFLYQQAGHTR